MSQSPGPGWWLASDGKWYPPHLHPDVRRVASADAPRRTVQPPAAERRESGAAPAQPAGPPSAAPLGDPSAPLPQRSPDQVPGSAPSAGPPVAVPPRQPSTAPPSTTPVPPPAQPPTAPLATPTTATPDAPAPERSPTAPLTTSAGTVAGDTPVVRWNSEQARQPVESAPAARGPGASLPSDTSDDNALIPLPDLEDEPPPTSAPKSTNKAPTLADTLLGARATTPKAALPNEVAEVPDVADGATAERWVRPEAGPPAVDSEAAPREAAPVAATTLTDLDTRGVADTDVAEQIDEAEQAEELAEADDLERPKSRSDRAVNIGVVLLAVVLAAGAAYFLLRDDAPDTDTAANERAVADLTVGDCFGGELLGTVEVELVPIVDCATPHQYEVFHATDFAPDDAPFNAEAIREQATAVCIEQLESIVGVPIGEAPVQLLLLNPTRESWRDDNDRTTLCLAYDPAGPLRDPIGS